MDALENFYSNYDENSRLIERDGRVEFLTTMKYIQDVIGTEKKVILDIGAGTGRYSIALAKEGHLVDAVEYTKHNVDIMRSMMDNDASVILYHGTALNLSKLENDHYDITLIFGPMYHIFEESEKLRVLNEAIRVTKTGGSIFVAYCMNEATVIQSAFLKGKIRDCIKNHIMTDDFRYSAKDVFSLVRIEDIDKLNAHFDNIRREKLVASDGAAVYIRDCLEKMDEETFELFMEYHFSVCERMDLIGASNHCLDILKKTSANNRTLN